MSKYVIDASVAVKWVIEEIQHIEARRYLDEKALEKKHSKIEILYNPMRIMLCTHNFFETGLL